MRFQITIVQNRIFHLAFWTAKYKPPIDKQVKMEHHFEKRINLLVMAYFTKIKFTNLGSSKN